VIELVEPGAHPLLAELERERPEVCCRRGLALARMVHAALGAIDGPARERLPCIPR
jgi:hypothetical protein